jgi:hypothetical protein
MRTGSVWAWLVARMDLGETPGWDWADWMHARLSFCGSRSLKAPQGEASRERLNRLFPWSHPRRVPSAANGEDGMSSSGT